MPERIRIPLVYRILIKGEHIKLDSLLKLAGITSTGGEAKELIQGGLVFVDGLPVTARGRKIKDGMTVKTGDRILRVKTGEAESPGAADSEGV
ncbi:MAG: RNA-binding S4 domain-containing protein [Oscillospiraceae bacterium]|jgi:ribosome-associated protein|nr:RNA-binding S4 domain-containing protein [Oscillospiraceae bacterium]